MVAPVIVAVGAYVARGVAMNVAANVLTSISERAIKGELMSDVRSGKLFADGYNNAKEMITNPFNTVMNGVTTKAGLDLFDKVGKVGKTAMLAYEAYSAVKSEQKQIQTMKMG